MCRPCIGPSHIGSFIQQVTYALGLYTLGQNALSPDELVKGGFYEYC
jgi:hypothetical protein